MTGDYIGVIHSQANDDDQRGAKGGSSISGEANPQFNTSKYFKHNKLQWDKRHPFIEMAIPMRHRQITQRLRLRRGGALGGRPRLGTNFPPPPPRAPPAARARGNARRGKLNISSRNPKNNYSCSNIPRRHLPFFPRVIPETPPLLLLLNSISFRRNSPLTRRPR